MRTRIESLALIEATKPFYHCSCGLLVCEEAGAMVITTSINAVGLLKATEMIQSARTEAAIEHRDGLHTVTMAVPDPVDAGSQAQKDARGLPAPQKRVVDISV